MSARLSKEKTLLSEDPSVLMNFFLIFDRCIPKYWQVKDMSNLSDTKKKEINDLNNNMFHQLSKEFDYLKEGKTGDGQIFIQIGVVYVLLSLVP